MQLDSFIQNKTLKTSFQWKGKAGEPQRMAAVCEPEAQAQLHSLGSIVGMK